MTNPVVYTKDAISSDLQGNSYIQITLASKQVELPIKSIPTTDGEILLAWVDPNRDDIQTYGARALAALLKQINPSLVITPFSSKSVAMATLAVENFSQQTNKKITLVTLHGGKDKKTIKSQIGKEGLLLAYNPVTSLTKKKYVGISPEHAALITKEIIAGNTVAILDDVYSSGATIQAVRKAIELITATTLPNHKLPAVVIAQETATPTKPQNKAAVFPCIILPIVFQSKKINSIQL